MTSERMTAEHLRLIAKAHEHAKSIGKKISLTTAEIDALLAAAEDAERMREAIERTTQWSLGEPYGHLHRVYDDSGWVSVDSQLNHRSHATVWEALESLTDPAAGGGE